MRGKNRKQQITKLLHKVLKLSIPLTILLCICTVITTLSSSRPHVEYSTVVHFSNGKPMRIFPTSQGLFRYKLALRDIDPLFLKATICYEDKRFFYHPGVDFLAVMRAAFQNIKARRIISGASTITLQLVRLLNPAPRTFTQKIIEAFKAIAMELLMTKEEILETYVNLAPYGGNIEGVGAASLYYFGKLPRDLSIEEIAFLVSLPQSPRKTSPNRRIGAIAKVLTRMEMCGLINSKEKEIALKSIKSRRRFHPAGFPWRAPHAAEYLKTLYSRKIHILSTIDEGIQSIVSTVIRSHRNRLAHLGAHQASVVVISNKDRSVKALLGSLNYWDTTHAGQVKGFNAPRSTGSTLKPFLYALALQNGIITPETRLEDSAKIFGAFSPVNFSHEERNLVRARNALKLSLNLPFINLLNDVGLYEFYDFLRKFNCKWTKNPGLSSVTGGIELPLLHLTNMYTTFARKGKFGKPVFLLGQKVKEKGIVHPGAAYLTIKALTLENYPFDIAQKTGTSFGRRDAWAIGISPDYTVGVWVGNFSGRGSQGIVGARAAAPILHDIMVEIENPGSYFTVPLKWLTSIDICPESGLPVSPNCPKKNRIFYPKGVTLPVQCNWHRIYLVEKESGFRACPFKNYPKNSITPKVFLVYPWMQGPAVAPNCEMIPSNNYDKIRIIKPVNMRTYFLSSSSSKLIPVKAKTFTTVQKRIFWFVNGKLKTVTHGGSIGLIEASRGPMEILAVTENGAWDKVKIWVYM